MDALLQIFNRVVDHRIRAEDLVQRDYENRRHRIEDSRRLVDQKAEQLKNISSLAALIAGFAMVVLVESQIDENASFQILAGPEFEEHIHKPAKNFRGGRGSPDTQGLKATSRCGLQIN